VLLAQTQIPPFPVILVVGHEVQLNPLVQRAQKYKQGAQTLVEGLI